MSDIRIPLAPAIPAEAKMADRSFFAEHHDRRLRIRPPIGDEYLSEFRQLGPHNQDRRAVIVTRIRPSLAKRYHVDFMRIPFLLFADETVEDRDDILAPIVDEMMRGAASSGS